MKKTSLKYVVAALALALVPSCMQIQPTATETIPEAEVVLGKKNFRVIATQVSGEDTGFALLTGIQAFSRFLSVVPFIHVTNLPSGITIDSVSDSKALDNLYKNSGASNTGRATQLINVRKEFGGFNAIIFGRPKIRYTADLIEFCPQGGVSIPQTEQKTAQESAKSSSKSKSEAKKKRRR